MRKIQMKMAFKGKNCARSKKCGVDAENKMFKGLEECNRFQESDMYFEMQTVLTVSELFRMR